VRVHHEGTRAARAARRGWPTAPASPSAQSRLKTAEFYRLIKPYLADHFAPRHLHGSLADVYGVGLFFTGKSGIGKSECVLDLVERGHRLVADDLVFVSRRGNDVLIGRGHELQRHFMEIRGVGLIDVPAIFGIKPCVSRSARSGRGARGVERRSERRSHRARCAAPWILGVELPRITVHLNPGKNITVIAEVIAMNHLLRYHRGYDSATAFNERLINSMRRKSEDAHRYLLEDDE
jgi:HPr kinase/phosphorylase